MQPGYFAFEAILLSREERCCHISRFLPISRTQFPSTHFIANFSPRTIYATRVLYNVISHSILDIWKLRDSKRRISRLIPKFTMYAYARISLSASESGISNYKSAKKRASKEQKMKARQLCWLRSSFIVALADAGKTSTLIIRWCRRAAAVVHIQRAHKELADEEKRF